MLQISQLRELAWGGRVGEEGSGDYPAFAPRNKACVFWHMPRGQEEVMGQWGMARLFLDVAYKVCIRVWCWDVGEAIPAPDSSEVRAGASGLITLIVMGMFNKSMAFVGCNYGNELLTNIFMLLPLRIHYLRIQPLLEEAGFVKWCRRWIEMI